MPQRDSLGKLPKLECFINFPSGIITEIERLRSYLCVKRSDLHQLQEQTELSFLAICRRCGIRTSSRYCAQTQILGFRFAPTCTVPISHVGCKVPSRSGR